MHDHRVPWRRFAAAAAPLVGSFRAAHRDPAGAQRAILDRLVRAAADTPFGRRHDFASVRDHRDYAERVPVSSWADMARWVDPFDERFDPHGGAIPPSFFEPTSGSSARRKLIPYTSALLAEFQRAVLVWLATLHRACPAIAAGRSYWALSPPFRPSAASPPTTPEGVPIGGNGDASYLVDSAAMPLLGSVLGPAWRDRPGSDWRLATLVSMIEADDLTLISVWSPTFLLSLLAPLLDVDSPDGVRAFDALRGELTPRRRVAVARAVSSGDIGSLWPRLAVISCWMDGASERYAAVLAERFPTVRFVPKGLLATEGVVSLSYGVAERCPLALDSHFLEFRREGGGVVLADELERGERYQPLLSTGGGLYRYALGDVVEAVEPVDGLTCVRFVGRADARCDLVGEKLDESLVATALHDATSGRAAAMLVPDERGDVPRYALLIERAAPCRADRAAVATEGALARIHHYAQARRLRQLGPVVALPVPDIAASLQAAWEATGGRAGDCKPCALVTSASLAAALLRGVRTDPEETEA